MFGVSVIVSDFYSSSIIPSVTGNKSILFDRVLNKDFYVDLFRIVWMVNLM